MQTLSAASFLNSFKPHGSTTAPTGGEVAQVNLNLAGLYAAAARLETVRLGRGSALRDRPSAGNHPMRTIDYTIGERKIWRAVPRNAAGGMADLTGASAELRITVTGDLCLPVAAQPDGGGFPFALSPESLDIPSGRYAAQL